VPTLLRGGERTLTNVDRTRKLAMRRLLPLMLTSCIAFEASADKGEVCPERPDDEDDRKALAGVWFSRGDALAAEERYERAVAAYRCSLEMVEHTSTLYNAAQSARLAGQNELALDLLNRWLKLAPYDEMTDQVVEQIAELEGLVGPRGEPGELPPEEQPEEGTGGEYVEHPDGPPAEDDGGLAVAGWVTFGVGAAAAIAGGVFQGLAAKYESDAESTSKLEEWNDFSAKTDTFQKTAIAAFVVGGVAIGAGVTMIVLGSGEDDDAEVAFVPVPGGLSLQGSF
jgi:tetratricopeptide (TPR) repeat protein